MICHSLFLNEFRIGILAFFWHRVTLSILFLQWQNSEKEVIKMNNETEQIFLLNPSGNQASDAIPKLTEIVTTTQVNLENVEDFSMVCRTCATITECVIPIFSGEGLQNNLAEKIHKHLPIKVSEEDELPRAVCYQCVNTLLAWHELVECCEQADAALRTRLGQIHSQKEKQPSAIINEENSAVDQNTTQNGFVVSLVPARDPPEYQAKPAPGSKPCPYCPAHPAPEDYHEHLTTVHSDLIFHCEECNTYIARKEFLLHMSLHVFQYSKKDDPKSPEDSESNKIKKEDGNIKDVNENTEPQINIVEKSNGLFEVMPEINIFPESDVNNDKTIANTISENITIIEKIHAANDQNEFSDHSDAEFGFGPLPESVFEAIEDSQDSNPEDALTEDIRDISMNESENENVLDVSGEKNRKKRKRNRVCPVCQKVYTASSSYFYHMKYSHKRPREHACELCGRKFGTKGCLTQHMAIHSKNCDYECKVCRKRFRSNASLYIHEQTHNGVKTYSCNQCHNISFRWRTHLVRHMKRHAAEKAHICTTCGKGFTIHCDLLRHARTHNAGEFRCDKCGAKFAQLRYLKVHMDKKHLQSDTLLAPNSLPVVLVSPLSR